MGVLAQAFGSLKGRIEVAVDKARYAPGELVTGTIRLVVTEELDGGPFTLQFQGLEKIMYREGTGDDETYMRTQHVFMEQQASVNAHAQVYPVGESLYPFQFPLAPDLPGVFHIVEPSAHHRNDLDVAREYLLQARLQVQGKLANDLVGEFRVTVLRRAPVDTSVAKPSMLSASGPVFFVCPCLPRGRCTVDVAVDKDIALATPHDKLVVQYKVNNTATRPVRMVKVVLLELLVMHDGKIYTHPKAVDSAAPFLLLQRELGGVDPGASRAGEVVFEMNEVLHAARSPRLQFESHYVTIKYHVAVQCQYAWSQQVEVAVPIKLLPSPEPPQAGHPAARPAPLAARGMPNQADTADA